MIIGSREVGVGRSPYIVAEIGAAHNASLDVMRALMVEARDAGADALKIQAFTEDTITINSHDPEFIVQSGPWKGWRLYDLYEVASTPREWYPEIFSYAKTLGIPVFASVFSREDLAEMERMGCPVYKIASPEIVDVDLIGAVAATHKPMILSTGMAQEGDVTQALLAITQDGRQLDNVCVLHCVSEYPVSEGGEGMGIISEMQRTLGGVAIGYSDHTIGITAAIAATALGAALIEKHITLSRDAGGLDDGFASTPEEFAMMVRAVRRTHKSMRRESSTGEMAHFSLRRSLYVVKDIKAGEQFTRDNVRSIRPSKGLEVKHLPTVLNSVANRDIQAGTPLSLDFVGR